MTYSPGCTALQGSQTQSFRLGVHPGWYFTFCVFASCSAKPLHINHMLLLVAFRRNTCLNINTQGCILALHALSNICRMHTLGILWLACVLDQPWFNRNEEYHTDHAVGASNSQA